MNAPSPADRVEAALTPPWGTLLDRLTRANPGAFCVASFPWRPDSEGFLAPDPNGPRPEDPVGMCTCSDLPAVMEAEVLPPAEAVCCDATPAAALVPASRPIRRLAVGPGHLAFIPTDPALLHHPAEILQADFAEAEIRIAAGLVSEAEARLHREGQTSPHFFPGSLKEAAAVLGGPSEVAEYIRVAREEVIPLVTSPEGAARAARKAKKKGRR